MYSGSGFSDWEIGDITVIVHNGIYHLFHLIIPNHDYIAHAVSRDGISWKRVKNALFVGNPGEWDDDMLWTMHVCHVNDRFEMYYTGLQRRDRGGVSRIGLAFSENLLDWEKSKKAIFPIEPKGVFYEDLSHSPRKWISFRDPFRVEYEDEIYLLICARTISGPVSRRGCVGLVKITNDIVERMPPLLYPMVYDDIECPCIFQLKNRFYIIGSIREDIKVRYWHSNDFFGEYHSFDLDILLPQGNYAARISEDDGHLLIYNFFYPYGKINTFRVLPPPKEVDTDEDGKLILKSYYRWDEMVIKTIEQNESASFKQLFSNPTAFCNNNSGQWIFGSGSGYELFCFKKPSNSYIWEGQLAIEGLGKLGLLCEMDEEGNGYFISLDFSHGLVEFRTWGFNPQNNKENFIFESIQSGFFNGYEKDSIHFRLIHYGHYFELSVNETIILTLMDYTYNGEYVGFYSASSIISLQHSLMKILPDPEDEYASNKEPE